MGAFANKDRFQVGDILASPEHTIAATQALAELIENDDGLDEDITLSS